MIVDRHDPINLFEMVPKLKLEFEPELVELDVLLEDDALFKLVKTDLLNATLTLRDSDAIPHRWR
jgi:hypothetical protein